MTNADSRLIVDALKAMSPDSREAFLKEASDEEIAVIDRAIDDLKAGEEEEKLASFRRAGHAMGEGFLEALAKEK